MGTDPLISRSRGGAPEAAAYVMDSRTLLRRLVRLDVAVDYLHTREVTVRAPSGATATVKPGRWSRSQIDALLHTLAVPSADFQDTR